MRSLLVLFGLVLMFFLLLYLVPFSAHVTDTNQAKAKNTIYNLKNAIVAYFTEYRTFPVVSEVGDTTVDSGHSLMDVLLASDKEAEEGGANRRRIVFYSGTKARPAGNGRSRRGITLDKDGGGELWDPWGNRYRIRYDSDRDRHVESPQYPGRLMLGSIFIWSAGEDGNFETWEDNVKSWEPGQ